MPAPAWCTSIRCDVTTPRPRQIAVVGAGITGSVLAMRLADRGHAVHLLERRPDPRAMTADGDRSINLALSHRGLQSLERVGLADAVRANGIPMRGRMIHDMSGSRTFSPYGIVPEHHLLSVSRSGLNRLLVEAADQRPGIELSFDHHVTDIDLDAVEIDAQVTGGGTRRARYDTVFGADGAYSAVRQRLQRTASFDFEQDFLEHGYKELTVPADAEGAFVMEPEALHIWPRGSYMLIALPNVDGTFTCTLFWPLEGHGSLATDADAALATLRRDFADAVGLMPQLDTEWREHPVGTLLTTRCEPWNLGGRVLLLGDAAHAVVPFYGQGANAGLEDVTLLMDDLDRHDDWAQAFDHFARTRKPHADALAQLALDNYVEMRDHVASRWFLMGQSVERGLHRLLPHRFIPLYTMVTFTSTPYGDAVRRAHRQMMVIRLAAILVGLVVVAVIALLLRLVL